MLDQIAAEIVHSICSFAGDRSSTHASTLAALSLTSRSIHIQAQPILYRDIYFAEGTRAHLFTDERITGGRIVLPFHESHSFSRIHDFCRSLVSRPELGLHVNSFTLLTNEYTSDTRDIIDVILKRSSNLKRLCIAYDDPQTPNIIPPCFETEPPPFQLEYFSWPRYTLADLPLFANFLSAQTSIRHLDFPDHTIFLPPDWALPHLCILQTSFSQAIHLAAGRNITHLYLSRLPWDTFTLDGSVAHVFNSVRVFRAQGHPGHTLLLASVMPKLECLQFHGVVTFMSGEDFAMEVVSTLGSSSIKYIRLDPSFSVKRDERRDVYHAFEQLPSLKWIECDVDGDGIYERWHCGSEYSDTSHVPLVRWSSPETAWLEDDWDKGYSEDVPRCQTRMEEDDEYY